MNKITILIAVLSLTFSTFATAQRGGTQRPSADDIFEKLDTNNDGYIAKAEAEGRLAENFDTIDTDNNGYLTTTELENAPKPQGRKGRGNRGNMTTTETSTATTTTRKERPTTAEMFAKMDTNNDGYIAESEAKGPLLKNFATIDTDNNGYITEAELANAPKPQGYQNNNVNTSTVTTNTTGTVNTQRRQRGNGQRPTTAEIMTEMDANNDGYLSRTEAKGPLADNFDTIDTDNNDYITTEELENAPKQQGRKRRGRSQR